jgi:hypothetical protein
MEVFMDNPLSKELSGGKKILHPADPHPTPFAYNIVARNLGQLIIKDFCD